MRSYLTLDEVEATSATTFLLSIIMVKPSEDIIEATMADSAQKKVEDAVDAKVVDVSRKRASMSSRKRSLSIDSVSVNKIRKEDEMQNLCISCGDDMGDCNPRQLCGKTKCLKDDSNDGCFELSNNIGDQYTLFVPPSLKDFMLEVEKEKPLKWKSLDTNLVYVVDSVEETEVVDRSDGGTRKAYIGTFRSGGIDSRAKVWLPGMVSKKLLGLCGDSNKIVCIRPLGEKTSSKSGRVYENFDIHVYNRSQQPKYGNCDS